MVVRTPGIALLLAVLIGGCSADGAPSGQDSVAAPPGPDGENILALHFDDVVADFGSLISAVENHGTAALEVSVTTARDGRVRLGRDVDGGGAAVLPAFDDISAPAAALLAVPAEPADTTDPLEPGRRAFVFGASFSIDRRSAGGDRDNGNNLVQRGLFADPAQYKIQLDDGVPSCRIAGRSGAAVVSFEEAVPPEHWFAVECSRRGTTVTLRLTDLEGDGGTETVSAQQRTGALQFDDGVPLAVGAKVTADGTIPEGSTDQFNGAVDGAFYRAPS